MAATPDTSIATRGELSAASAPPSAKPIAGQSAPIDSTAPIRRPCSAFGVSCCTRADQRRPLHAVADAAHQRRRAGHRERRREREAEVGERRRATCPRRASARAAGARRGRTRRAEHHADAPDVHQQAVAAVAGVSVAWRKAPRPARRRRRTRPPPPRSAAGCAAAGISLRYRHAASSRARTECRRRPRVRMHAGSERRADHERRRVDQQRRGCPRHFDDQAADQRHHRGSR